MERGADCLHMVQLMPLTSQNPIISCLILIRNVSEFKSLFECCRNLTILGKSFRVLSPVPMSVSLQGCASVQLCSRIIWSAVDLLFRSVRSRDTSVVVSVCEFLTDVVFQDFPAEVFLQRPSIVKVGRLAVVSVFDIR